MKDFNNLTTTEKRELYLSYVNDFISVYSFADHYNIAQEDANNIINEGRELHEQFVKDVKPYDIIKENENAEIRRYTKGSLKGLYIVTTKPSEKYDRDFLSFVNYEEAKDRFTILTNDIAKL